jgi:hypothetical protein
MSHSLWLSPLLAKSVVAEYGVSMEMEKADHVSAQALSIIGASELAVALSFPSHPEDAIVVLIPTRYCLPFFLMLMRFGIYACVFT